MGMKARVVCSGVLLTLLVSIVPTVVFSLSFPKTYNTQMQLKVTTDNGLCEAELDLAITLHADGSTEVTYPYFEVPRDNPSACHIREDLGTFKGTEAGSHDKQDSFSAKVYHAITSGHFDEGGISGTGTATESIGDREEIWTVSFGGNCPAPSALSEAVYCEQEDFLSETESGKLPWPLASEIRFDYIYGLMNPAIALGFSLKNTGQEDCLVSLSPANQKLHSETFTISRGTTGFVGVQTRDPIESFSISSHPSSCLDGLRVSDAFCLSVVDVSNSSTVYIETAKDETFLVYAQTEPDRMNWLFFEIPEIFPGIWFARPNDEYCASRGRYLHVFGLDVEELSLPDEADLWIFGPPALPGDKHALLGFRNADDPDNPENLYYTSSASGSKVELGILKISEGMGTLILRMANGDLDELPSLNVTQRISFTSYE
jgi:hypothetical protein